MRERKNRRIRILIIGLFFLIMVGTVYLCSRLVAENLKIEMQNTLRDVAEQNNVAVQKEIDARFQLLFSIAQEIEEEPDDVKALLDSTKSFVENYRFKRIGYIFPIGVAYTTDGYIQDMSYLNFFREGMAGKISITDALADTVGDDTRYINQFSVPVYNEDETEINGVLFATYRTEWFEDILNTHAFEGKGYSCIVKADGDVIAHSKGSPIYGIINFFTYLNQNGTQEDAKTSEQMHGAMQQGLSGTGSLSLNGETDFYYVPLNLEGGELDWYMVTLVPEGVLTDRLQPIMNNVDQMMLVLVIVIISGVSIFLLSDRMRKKELISLAYIDSLTKGDNYACFQEKMKANKDVHGYMIAMDLSEFKIINNTCGIEKGDEVLAEVWKVLDHCIRANELAARIYADRFILFFIEEEKQKVKERLDRLSDDIAKVSDELSVPRVVPVFGVYETFNREEVEKQYGNAVQAKRLVKGRRDCNYAFYEELDYNLVLENRAIEDGFEQAVADEQFEVWYQPKYDAAEGTIVGSEALVRWRREDGSLLSPFRFIPIFEKNGMIPRLDEYVFKTVCRQQKQWESQGRKILPVSVNISRVSLYYYNIVEKYKAISVANDMKPDYVQLEITESATIDNAELSNLIEQFHEAGFQLLLDDFGSGYSSLSTLNMMHFDTMKLDKSLIDYIGDENGEKLLHYIVKLGQNLGLHITAEGVETKEQLEFLRDLECDDIQGYYFSKPLPLAEYEGLLYNL